MGANVCWHGNKARGAYLLSMGEGYTFYEFERRRRERERESEGGGEGRGERESMYIIVNFVQ